MIAKFSGPFYLQFAVVFFFKVDCAKYHRGLSKKRFQDIYNQPDVQKHAVITFSFKPFNILKAIFYNNSCSRNYRPLKVTKRQSRLK